MFRIGSVLALAAALLVATAPAARAQDDRRATNTPVPDNPVTLQLKQLADWSRTSFGSNDPGLAADTAAAKQALLANGGVAGGAKGRVVFQVTNCQRLYSIMDAVNQLTLESTNTATWIVELSCAGGPTAFLDCQNLALSPLTGGSLTMAVTGAGRVKVRAAQDCGGDRPIIAGGSNVDAPMFYFGTNDASFVATLRVRMENLIVLGHNARPCVSALSTRRITLVNVDLINCTNKYMGAAIQAVDTPVNYRGGVVSGAVLLPIPPTETSFPAGGAGISLANYNYQGTVLGVSNVNFTGNRGINTLGGAFYFQTYIARTVMVRFNGGSMIGNQAPFCGVGAIFRADRFKQGNGRLVQGRFQLALNVLLQDNVGRVNASQANTQVCGLYQQPVYGSGTGPQDAPLNSLTVFNPPLPPSFISVPGVFGVPAPAPLKEADIEYVYVAP